MGTDALSDVLRAIKLTGAVFFTVDVSPPWSAPVPNAETLRPIIMPSAQHLISFHLVTAGGGWGVPPPTEAGLVAGGGGSGFSRRRAPHTCSTPERAGP